MILKTRLLPFQTPLNYEAQERQKYLETITFLLENCLKDSYHICANWARI